MIGDIATRGSLDPALVDSVSTAALEAADVGIVVHAADGAILSANRAAQTILGLDLEQLSGRAAIDPRWRLEHDDGRPVDADQIPSEHTARTGEAVTRAALRVRRGDGVQVNLEVSTVPLGPRPAGGARVPVVATFVDVTAHRRALAEVERARQLLERVTSAAPGMLFQLTVPARGRPRIVFSSVAEPRATATHFGAVRPMALWRRVRGPARDKVCARLRDGLRDRAPLVIEAELTAPDDPTRLDTVSAQDLPSSRLQLHLAPGAAGSDTIWTGVVLDVTESRSLRDRLARVERRETAAAIAAGLAHDFNNLLTALLPSIELAREDAGPLGREALDDAERASRSAQALVRRLLSLSRAPTPSVAGVDLADVVRGVETLVRRLLPRAIMLRTRVDVERAWLRAEVATLEHVVINLLLNARDALVGRPGPLIELGLDAADDGSGDVRLTVRDNGAGMPPEVLERLGEPFFTTKGREGHGLGLATAIATIRALGGRLEAHSMVGEGTTITVRLPTNRGGD